MCRISECFLSNANVSFLKCSSLSPIVLDLLHHLQEVSLRAYKGMPGLMKPAIESFDCPLGMKEEPFSNTIQPISTATALYPFDRISLYHCLNFISLYPTRVPHLTSLYGPISATHLVFYSSPSSPSLYSYHSIPQCVYRLPTTPL